MFMGGGGELILNDVNSVGEVLLGGVKRAFLGRYVLLESAFRIHCISPHNKGPQSLGSMVYCLNRP